jgi:hypothetical protein
MQRNFREEDKVNPDSSIAPFKYQEILRQKEVVKKYH